jgi:hypothetical protein
MTPSLMKMEAEAVVVLTIQLPRVGTELFIILGVVMIAGVIHCQNIKNFEK